MNPASPMLWTARLVRIVQIIMSMLGKEERGKGLTFGMPELELDQNPGGEEAEYSKKDDDDDTGDQTDDCERGRE